MPGNLLNSFYRPSDTNQRIYFQIDPHDRYLYSGTSEGELLIHDLKGATVGSGAILPSYGIKASSSTVAGIGLNGLLVIEMQPLENLVCTHTAMYWLSQLARECFHSLLQTIHRILMNTFIVLNSQNWTILYNYIPSPEPYNMTSCTAGYF
jgi:hypothetical protein